MELVLRDTASKIRATFVNADGAAEDPTGTPTVTVVRDTDGTTVVAAQNTTSEDPAGQHSYTLTPANVPEVDLLRASWSGTVDAQALTLVTEIGVVGGFLCSLEAISAEIVANGGSAPAVDVLRAKREEAERRLEDACGVAFRPSYRRQSDLRGDGGSSLLVDRPRLLRVLSASVDGDVIDVGGLSPSAVGTVERDDSIWPCGAEIELTYEHGWPSCPEPVSRAAVKLASVYAQAAGDDRITRFREDDQEVWLSMPGAGGTTGIPEVDQVIREYGYAVVA